MPHPQEALTATEEVGKDLEHVQMQKKKSDDFEKDMAINEAQLDKICVMANKLIEEEHSDAEQIHDMEEVTSHAHTPSQHAHTLTTCTHTPSQHAHTLTTCTHSITTCTHTPS